MVYTPLETELFEGLVSDDLSGWQAFWCEKSQVDRLFHHDFQGVSRADLPRFDPARYKQTKVVMAPLGLGVYTYIYIYRDA